MKPLFILSLLIGGSTLMLSTSSGQGQGQKEPLKLNKNEQIILDLTNETRKKANLSVLKPNPNLFEVARAYAKIMAKHQKADHYLEGTNLKQRIKASGYIHHIAGENLGLSEGGFPAEKIFQGWMDSQLHRENILEKKFTEIGLGAFTDEKGNTWYTQIFAVPFPKQND